MKFLTILSVLALVGLSQASSILFVDDDKGLNNTTWQSTLGSLGHSVVTETISSDGNPTSDFSVYDMVIWSVGDAAYTNLTSANVSKLTNFLNNGGNLLYTGGHDVYYEPSAHTFIQNYLGLTGYEYNMPTFNSTSAPGYGAASGHASVGAGTYVYNYWGGGHYGNMFSGFNAGLSTSQSLITAAGGMSGGATSYAMLNETYSYKAITWGFDLNHVTASQREQLLGSTVDYLTDSTVPEPGSLLLMGLGLVGIASLGLRKKK